MKTFSTVVAAAALPMLAAADAFWSDAPSCVQSCVSSAFTSSSDWPAPTAFCGSDGPAITSCFDASCGTATASVASSFSSISSSLCSLYSSCSAAGSTGVVTVTATAGSWGGYSGGGWGGSKSGPWGAGGSSWPSSGATTTFTVSGCGAYVTGGGWGGNGGWGGWGGNGNGGGGGGWGGESSWGGDGVWGGNGGFWGSSQKGWSYRTATTPLTTTYSAKGALVTATGIATVEEAVSGSSTSTTTFFAVAAEATSTGTSTGSTPSTSGSSINSAAGQESWATVKIVGLALGTMMVVVGLL